MNYKPYLAELIGTAALVFIGAGTAAVGSGGLVAVALAHGLVLLTLVYLLGDISGAHVNPAVTFGVMLAGEISLVKAIGYWIAQLAGGTAAALLLRFTLQGTTSSLGATVPAGGVSALQALVLEGVLTFFLVNAVLLGAVRKRAGSFAGVTIGLTLAFSILLGGPLTGASLNPARTFGPGLLTGTLDVFWIYLVGTLGGAGLAVVTSRVID